MFYSRNNIHGPHCTIYLFNLAKNVNEANLFKTFNQVGVISSARIVRNEQGQSQGRAYVNFINPVDAEKALKTMNGHLIEGQPVRIRRKKKECNLFVRNIHSDCTKPQLHEAFEKFGRVASCRIMVDKKNQSMGYGYVRFQNQEGADKAIEASSCEEGIKLCGKKIEVDYYQTWKERTHAMNMNEHFYTCIHVKGYPSDFTEKNLNEMFAELLISPDNIEVAKKEDGSNKNFCFCEFTDHEHAKKAVTELNGKDLGNGNTLSVSRLMSNFERQQQLRKQHLDQKRDNHNMYKGRNLYVKNFPLDWDQDQLKKLFEKYGKVTSTKVMKNSQDQSKGFGFVCFESKMAAQQAMHALSNKLVENKHLYVNMAELKETRQKHLWGSPHWREQTERASGRRRASAGVPTGITGYGRGWQRMPRGGPAYGGRGGQWSSPPRTRQPGFRGRPRGKPFYGYNQGLAPTNWIPMNVGPGLHR